MRSKLTIDKWGNKRWLLPNGDLHREDGPAIEFYDGDKVWFLNNIKYFEQEYKKKMRLKKLKHIL